MILLIDEDVLEAEIVAVEPKLFRALSRLQQPSEAVHHRHPTTHLLAYLLFTLDHVCDEEGAALHAPVVAVHHIPGPFPFVFALGEVPFVTLVTLVAGHGAHAMMP